MSVITLSVADLRVGDDKNGKLVKIELIKMVVA